MRLERNSKNSRIFFRYFISYMVVLLIPVFIGSVAYLQTLKVVEEDAKDINAIILQQGADTIDRYFTEMDNVMKQMALNTGIAQLMQINSPVNGPDIYNLYKTQQEISSYVNTNNFIYSFYIYFRNSGTIITKNASYTNAALFYEDYLKSKTINYNYWVNKLMAEYHYQDFLPATNFTINGMNRSIITYMQSIPIMGKSYAKGCISMLIDEREIQKLLDKINRKNGGWYYIEDRDGNIISSANGKQNDIRRMDIDFKNESGAENMIIHGEKVLVSYVLSTKNGWKYVAVIPYSAVMSKVEYIKKLTFITTLIILIAGFVIAFIITYQYSKPIRRIIKTIINRFGIENDFSDKNGFNLIEGAFTRLIDNNEYLRHMMMEQMPLIRAAFFERLIKGEFTNAKEIKSILALLGMQIRDGMYTVIVLQLRDYFETFEVEVLETIHKKRIIVKDVISRTAAEDNIFLHEVENDKLMLLLSTERKILDEISKSIVTYIDKINNVLHSIGYSCFHFGVGRTCESLLEIYKSYNEACQALEYGSIKSEGAIFWYKNINVDGNSYYFPLEVQARLFNLVKAGQSDELEKLLEEIYIENYHTRELSVEMMKQFLYEVRGLVIKLKEMIIFSDEKLQSEIANNQQMLEDIKPVNNGYTYFAGLLKMLCTTVKKQKKRHSTQLGVKIVDYVEANYEDAQLSLSSMATKFELNEAYLSYLFKEHTGENFSTYLENLRIRKACELLIKKPVHEVAGKVGYNSDHSFRRAFKRIMLISPTDYKKDKA